MRAEIGEIHPRGDFAIGRLRRQIGLQQALVQGVLEDRRKVAGCVAGQRVIARVESRLQHVLDARATANRTTMADGGRRHVNDAHRHEIAGRALHIARARHLCHKRGGHPRAAGFGLVAQNARARRGGIDRCHGGAFLAIMVGDLRQRHALGDEPGGVKGGAAHQRHQIQGGEGFVGAFRLVLVFVIRFGVDLILFGFGGGFVLILFVQHQVFVSRLIAHGGLLVARGLQPANHGHRGHLVRACGPRTPAQLRRCVSVNSVVESSAGDGLGLVNRRAEPQLQRLFGVKKGFGAHHLAHLISGQTRARGIDASPQIAFFLKLFRAAAVIFFSAAPAAVFIRRIMDHDLRARVHRDRVPGHGDQAGGAGGHAGDHDMHLRRMGAQQVVDRDTLIGITAAAVQEHGQIIGGRVDLRAHIGHGEMRLAPKGQAHGPFKIDLGHSDSSLSFCSKSSSPAFGAGALPWRN